MDVALLIVVIVGLVVLFLAIHVHEASRMTYR